MLLKSSEHLKVKFGSATRDFRQTNSHTPKAWFSRGFSLLPKHLIFWGACGSKTLHLTTSQFFYFAKCLKLSLPYLLTSIIKILISKCLTSKISKVGTESRIKSIILGQHPQSSKKDTFAMCYPEMP